MKKTKRLTESAMLIAIAVVLELVGKMVFPPMPFGGQLTLVSMLPIVLVSYRHGVKWGLTTGLCYGFVQMALGAGTVTAAFQPGYFGDGTMVGRAILMCLLDYVLAYTALGLGGCFRKQHWVPGMLPMLSPATFSSPDGPSGSSPRKAFPPGALPWRKPCPPRPWAGCTLLFTTACT